MGKLIVSANSIENLNSLLKKNIDGVLLYIDSLSVNSSFYINVDEIDKIDFKGKEVFIVLNKIMHNSDLSYLKSVMHKLKAKDVYILFYDMAVFKIAKELDMIDKLIIYQDHLNASTNTNNFYFNLGIQGSYITSDITKEELLEIKAKTKKKIMFTIYGYAPIFYSRRYLITNYLKFINEENEQSKYEIISDNGAVYPISEEAYGTTIYSPQVINLINYLDELESIDYLVMHSNNISDSEFNNMVDKFLKKEKITNPYIGLFETKTIYKVKGGE